MNNELQKRKDRLVQSLSERMMNKIKKQMKTYRVWLSYDLGFDEVSEKLSEQDKQNKYKERYDAFMPWLKAQAAKECGYSVAKFLYTINENTIIEDVLREEILKVFEDAKIKDLRGVRMYVVVAKRNKLGEADKFENMKSGFIIGKRHEVNPWD